MKRTWSCIRCNKLFPDYPGSEQPYSFEVAFDANGRRYIKGDICEPCATKPRS